MIISRSFPINTSINRFLHPKIRQDETRQKMSRRVAAAYELVLCVCHLPSQVTRPNHLQPREDHHGEGHTGGFVQSRGGDHEEAEGGPRERHCC